MTAASTPNGVALSVALTPSRGSGPGTHSQGRSLFRKGEVGFAELHCGNDQWVVTDWKNDELDIHHQFARLDGKPQRAPWERDDAAQEDDGEIDFPVPASLLRKLRKHV